MPWFLLKIDGFSAQCQVMDDTYNFILYVSSMSSYKCSTLLHPAGGSSVTQFTIKPASSGSQDSHKAESEVSVAAVTNHPEEEPDKAPKHSMVLEDKMSH